MAPPIRVGLMGYGFSTKCFHLPFILPNKDLEVVAFLQRAEAPKDKTNVEEGKHCTVDHPKAKHHRTADEFFADKDIDLVIVCASSGTHYEFGQKALNAGKHVVIEKPFAVTSAEADELIELAKSKGKILTVFQNRRYDSDFRTLQHLMSLEPNPFGKITEFANHYDLDQPEWVQKWKSTDLIPGEGMMYGLGTHSLDQTLLLFGRPKSVTAFLRVLRMDAPGASDDSFTIILQYDGKYRDLITTVKTTIVSSQPTNKQLKYSVRGTNGSFMKYGEDVQIDHLFAKVPVTDPSFGVEPESYYGQLFTKEQFDKEHQKKDESSSIFAGMIPSKQGCYADYYVDVVAAIRGEKDVVVKAEQSRDGIRLIELASESARKGVTVPWSDR